MTLSDIEQKNSTLVFSEITDQLQGNLSKNLGEYMIEVKNSLATGHIRGLEVQEHNLFLEIDLHCHQDMTIYLGDVALNPLHFLYSQKDQCLVSFGGSSQQHQFNEFQTAILHNKNKRTTLHFKKDSHVSLCIITVNLLKSAVALSSLMMNIHSLFIDNSQDGSFTYFGSYNLRIATQIQKLREVKEEGVVKKLMIEGMVQLILALEIQHHQDDISIANTFFDVLTKDELKTIQNFGLKIKNNVDNQYSLDGIANETGLTPAKLQIGFKHLFGRTVTGYIKNVRLEIAEELIKTTDLNISEIVYSVGFSSRSYFSKIFKEKFGCSPKTFHDNLKYSAMSA